MKQELVIDLGSKKTVIIKKDAGIVFKEPTIVITTTSGNNLKVVATGSSAAEMIGKTSPAEQIVYPISQGVIVNEKACELMLQDFIARIIGKPLIKPRISALVCISCGLTNVEKRSIEDVCNNAGINDVTLIESPIAVAGLIHESAAFIVDIGADKTEIAIVNDTGIIAGCSVDIGGSMINEAITDYIATKYKMIVHYNTTEKIKLSVATMREQDISQVAVNGKDTHTGELKTVKIAAAELRLAFVGVIDKLVRVIEDITLMIPDNLAGLIAGIGIYLCGGGAMLPGLDEYLEEKLNLTCNRMQQADDSVANGASRYLYNKERLQKMLNVENINIQ